MHHADQQRRNEMRYRRYGARSLQSPAISLGLWHDFGDTSSTDDAWAIVRRACNLGAAHFDPVVAPPILA
jgi:L-glyceraldehyde 3-phosphate reductase